jgi:putative iron-regulated protein
MALHRLIPSLSAIALLAPFAAQAADEAAVLATYADIARAGYEDSLSTAQTLRSAVADLVASPTADTLEKARSAWRAARIPYQQTEAFRFGNPLVDEWEGRVNSWPLDEGLIDYVAEAYGSESDANAFYTVNVIANAGISVGGAAVDATTITPDVLQALHEIGGVESNVATGYHAIEFLLWGQDLNGTGPGAGDRPASDFDLAACTAGHCDRRVQYLEAATDLLVSDLEEMAGLWGDDGEARKAVLQADPAAGLTAIMTGLGSLSYGEMAGERMKLGLLLNDPEEEHDCFSDNTHNSHYYDLLGMNNVWTGRYLRVDGTVVEGAAMADLVAARDPALAEEVGTRLDETLGAASALVARAEAGEAYDQMIGEGNIEGNAAVQAVIDGLIAQTRSFERVITTLSLADVTIEGSDSLDNPGAVFQ